MGEGLHGYKFCIAIDSPQNTAVHFDQEEDCSIVVGYLLVCIQCVIQHQSSLNLIEAMTEVVCRSPVSSDCNNQALQAAMELSMMNMSNCSPQGCVEPYYCLFDGYEGISKSLNVTQCVSVPSSEHVAEIVGKQGKLLV